MFSSTGNLHYGPGIRIIVSIDQGIVDYYRNLIPKHYSVQPQKYGAHVTVVRTGIEQPIWLPGGNTKGLPFLSSIARRFNTTALIGFSMSPAKESVTFGRS
jgi:hypothetical protein